MRPDDIIKLLRATPFCPFRLRVSDGSAYEIPRPESAPVGRSIVTIGVPGPQGPRTPVEDTVHVALVHVTRTELLEGGSPARV